jgi:hypothetical protein
MNRLAAVGVFLDFVMLLARSICRINVNRHAGEKL